MPAGKYDLSLILPAYNEAKTIRNTLTETVEYIQNRRWTYEIIVAADGDDGTRELAKDFSRGGAPVHVIGDSMRRGKGKGIRDGVLMASGEIIGFADADNKVPISEFDGLRLYFEEQYDIVIGSRAVDGSRIERKQPWHRRIGSFGFGHFMHSMVGLPGIKDTQCGFKFFRGAVAQDLFRRQRIDGYMFDVEVLALAQRLGYRIKEAPVVWRDDADSRLQMWSGNLQNVIDILKIRLSCPRQCKEAPAAARAQARGL